MHAGVDWAVAIVAVLVLAGMVRRARQAHGGGSRRPGSRRGQSRKGGWLAHRRRLREMREKHRLDAIRDEARHRRQAEREEARAAREREADREWREEHGDEPRPRRRGAAKTLRLRLRPDGTTEPDDAPDAPGTGRDGRIPVSEDAPRDDPGDDDGPGFPPPVPDPGPPGPPPPARKPASEPAPAPAPATREGNPVSIPAIRTGIEDLITAIGRIRAGAMAGNAKAKLAALKVCSEACARFAAMAVQIARQMAEQGHYGPEITERISAAGMHLTAAASAFSDSANGLETLLNLRLGEMPQSGRQAPHHAELSETGAR